MIGIKFSARKLKSQNINLLGGRARFMNFHPFTFNELKNHFSLDKVINYGLIPGIYFSENPELDFIMDNQIAVEVKGSSVFKKDFLNSIIKLKEENLLKEYYVVYLGKDLRLKDYPWLKIMNYQNFLKRLYRLK